MLRDEDIKHVSEFGILNQQYQPGQRAYGIPEPGIFLISAEGIIRFKFAEQDYRLRPDFSLVLEAASGL
jgi:peroxiredoxin